MHRTEEQAPRAQRQPGGQTMRTLPAPPFTGLLDLTFQPAHEQRQDLGHHGDARDALLTHAAEDGRGLQGVDVDDARADGEHVEELGDLLEHVGEREQGEHAVGLAGRENAVHGLKIAQDVVVAEHDALGRARGARGVDELG